MIEQLISAQVNQDALSSQAFNQPAANSSDVMRFNMELSDKKSDSIENSPLLQDVKVDSSHIDSDLLRMDGVAKDSTVSSPLNRLDTSYHAIIDQMSKVPEFDKFLDITQNEKAPAVRTNVQETEAKDPADEVRKILEETREIYRTAGSYSKDISKWHITTQIWSANIKILTTVVGQASQGFKTLFRSAG